MSGFVVWMTGLSGTGKSTLASLLTTELTARGVHVECLDGDEVRQILSHGLGFAREDRDRNVRRVGYVARMVARSGSCAITAAISPYRALRDEIRRRTENFIEVYCECPIEVLTERDPKGLYKRALAGEIKNFTGVTDPYEAPENPEVHLRTDLATPEECIEQIIGVLEERGLLGSSGARTSLLPPAFGGEVFEARQLSDADVEQGTRRLLVDARLAAEIAFVAAGFVSPLSGFMTMREAHKVEKGSALERGTPWWDRRFVLPLAAGCELAPGDHALIAHDERVVAEITCDDIWEENGVSYVAGPINAVCSDGRITAREVRRQLQKGAQVSTASCLFADAGPEPRALQQLKFARDITEAVALAVRAPHLGQWREALQQEGLNIPCFGVPDAIPFLNQRAQAVIARSIGALKFSTI